MGFQILKNIYFYLVLQKNWSETHVFFSLFIFHAQHLVSYRYYLVLRTSKRRSSDYAVANKSKLCEKIILRPFHIFQYSKIKKYIFYTI